MRASKTRLSKTRASKMSACAVLAACGAAAPAQLVSYILDDGAGGFNIGPSQFDAWMTWGNVFDAVPGGEIITEVSVSLSSGVAPGTPMKILIYDDPTNDLDPRDGVLLSVTDAVGGATALDEFLRFDVNPATVSGSFFVAIAMDVPQRQSTARMDQDTLGTRSWLFYDGVFNTDLSTQGFDLRMSDSPFNGTWMVRAGGIPTPGGLGLLGVAGFLVTRRKR